MSRNTPARRILYTKLPQLAFWVSGSDTPRGHFVRYMQLRDQMSPREARRLRKLWTKFPNHGGVNWCDNGGQMYAAEAQAGGMRRNTYEDYLTKRCKILRMWYWMGFQFGDVQERGVQWLGRQLRLDQERKRTRYDFQSAIMSVVPGRAVYRLLWRKAYERYMKNFDASKDRLFCTECQKMMLIECGYNDPDVQRRVRSLVGGHEVRPLPDHPHPMNMAAFMDDYVQFREITDFQVAI